MTEMAAALSDITPAAATAPAEDEPPPVAATAVPAPVRPAADSSVPAEEATAEAAAAVTAVESVSEAPREVAVGPLGPLLSWAGEDAIKVLPIDFGTGNSGDDVPTAVLVIENRSGVQARYTASVEKYMAGTAGPRSPGSGQLIPQRCVIPCALSGFCLI
jgi:hypothetical protein